MHESTGRTWSECPQTRIIDSCLLHVLTSMQQADIGTTIKLLEGDSSLTQNTVSRCSDGLDPSHVMTAHM